MGRQGEGVVSDQRDDRFEARAGFVDDEARADRWFDDPQPLDADEFPPDPREVDVEGVPYRRRRRRAFRVRRGDRQR